MFENYQEAFNEFVQSLRMTKMSLEVWADTDEKKVIVEDKLVVLNSAIELGTMLYNGVGHKEKQSV